MRALILLLIPLLSCNQNKSDTQFTHAESSDFNTSTEISNKFGDYNLHARMKHYKVPGICISVVKDGKIVWNQGYGLKDLKNRNKVDSLTLFQAASISKPITALGVLKLVEQGLLDLDVDVNNYLKRYKIPKNNYTKNTKITLRAILSHTAGLNISGVEGYHQVDRLDLPSTHELISGKGNHDKVVVIDTPYEKFNYSGGGYTILQKVIEDISNKSFEEYMKNEILTPLGMTMSTFEQPLPEKLHKNVATAHGIDGKMIDGKWQVFPAKAAAGLWTTASDLAKYCIEIQNIYSGKNKHGVLSKEMVKSMFSNPYHVEINEPMPPSLTNEPDDYWGLGPIMIGEGQNQRFKHGGSNAGFKSNYTAFVNLPDAIIVMTNGDNGYLLIDEIEKVLLNYYKMGTK